MADRLLIRTPSTPATTFDADATNIINRMVSAGGSVTQGRRVSINQTILDIKAGNSWNGLDALVIFGAGIESVALLNWKQNAFNPTIVVQPEFIAWNGYKGDGATTYIDSNFNPTTAGGNFSLNSATIGGIVLSPTGITGSECIIGGGGLSFVIGNTCRLNNGFNSGVPSTGLSYQIIRTSNVLATVYVNGVSVSSEANPTTGMDNVNLHVMRRNNVGGQSYMNKLCGAYWIGDGTINAMVMHNAILRYLMGVGASIPNY